MPETITEILDSLTAGERPTIRSVVRASAALYLAAPRSISLAAIVTFIPIDVLTVILHGWSDRLLELGNSGLSALTLDVSFFLITAGQVFLAGVIDHMVAASVEGGSVVGFSDVYRRLPLARLIAADLVASVVVAIASLFLLIPGVIAFALLGIVGPVINIEHRGIFGSLRRSARLVRPHLWMACVLIVIPFYVEFGIDDWFQEFAKGVALGVTIIVSLVMSVSLRATVSLFEVILGNALIRRDSEHGEGHRNA